MKQNEKREKREKRKKGLNTEEVGYYYDCKALVKTRS